MMLDNCDWIPDFSITPSIEKKLCFWPYPVSSGHPGSQPLPGFPGKMIVTGGWKDESVKSVPLKLFAQEPFVMLKPENDTRKRAVEILERAGISPEISLELDQQLTSYHVVCSGLGIAFVSDTLIREVPAARTWPI